MAVISHRVVTEPNAKSLRVSSEIAKWIVDDVNPTLSCLPQQQCSTSPPPHNGSLPFIVFLTSFLIFSILSYPSSILFLSVLLPSKLPPFSWKRLELVGNSNALTLLTDYTLSSLQCAQGVYKSTWDVYKDLTEKGILEQCFHEYAVSTSV